MKFLLVVILPCLFVLASCGKTGDGGILGGGKDDAPVGGIDAYLVGGFSGLRYTSESFSGTVTSGYFKCKRNEQVDFYLATSSQPYHIHVGSFYCADVASPIELISWGAKKVDSDINNMGVDGVSKDYRIALVRWLKMMYLLDSDSNETNGITLTNAKNNIFRDHAENKPFHPDQIFGNYTTSNVSSVLEYDTFILDVEQYLGSVALSETEVLKLLDEARMGCNSVSCSASRLY